MSATELRGLDLPLLAAADLTDKQGYIVKYTTTARQVALAAAKTDNLVGILLNEPNAAGRAAAVRVSGLMWNVAGGVVSVGDLITSDSLGRGVKATWVDTNLIWVVGRALTAATAAGEKFTLDINVFFFAAGAASV